MAEELRDELRQAYDLIRAGDKTAALQMLKPICQAHPDSAEAWWLVANAFSDPRQSRKALQRVLKIDPAHDRAKRRLAKLDAAMSRAGGPAAASSPGARATTQAVIGKTKAPPAKARSNRAFIILVSIMGAILVIGVVLSVVVILAK